MGDISRLHSVVGISILQLLAGERIKFANMPPLPIVNLDRSVLVIPFINPALAVAPSFAQAAALSTRSLRPVDPCLRETGKHSSQRRKRAHLSHMSDWCGMRSLRVFHESRNPPLAKIHDSLS